jgi:hypothetical protein
MIRIIVAFTLCGAPLPATAGTHPSLEAVKAGGFPSFSLREAFTAPSPSSVAPVFLRNTAASSVHAVHTSISNQDAAAGVELNETYQLGDQWGKAPVTPESLSKESAVFQRAAKATTRFGGGTAFYIGKFNGHHMMATNNHVMKSMGCSGRKAEFVLLERSFPCEKTYGSWKEVDLALFSIKVSAEEEAVLSGLGRNFAYDAAIYPGQELLTIGFGIADNQRRRMVANQDSDCKVFSGRNEFRKLADPDRLNPGPDKVWSFANGCDISHGDSGSSYVDRKTGDVLGIVWTGRIPKSPQVGSSQYLAEMLRAQSEEIWVELSYTVPAASIRSVLSAFLEAGSSSPDEAATLGAIVGDGGDAVASR